MGGIRGRNSARSKIALLRSAAGCGVSRYTLQQLRDSLCCIHVGAGVDVLRQRLDVDIKPLLRARGSRQGWVGGGNAEKHGAMAPAQSPHIKELHNRDTASTERAPGPG